jgi:hypothetical protein
MAKVTIPVEFELTAQTEELLDLLVRMKKAPLVPAESAPIATNSVATAQPPAHGEYWEGQGGYYVCTLPALLGLPERHLIVGKEEAKRTFSPQQEFSGCASHIDGPANTKALLAHGDHPAAQWAAAYTADGHQDFHLPAKLDLVMAHICAPQLFDKEGYYWTSTQSSRSNAFVQDFENGLSHWDYKVHERRVRAFRWIQL